MKLVASNHPILKMPVRQVAQHELPGVAGLWAEAMQLIRFKQAYGMASNQVGDSRAWFVFNNTLAINPEILMRSEETAEYTEGCLSYPKQSASIRRPVAITVRYINQKLETVEEILEDKLDANGKPVASNMSARVFQHEFDHLQGCCLVGVISAENMAKAQMTLQQAITTPTAYVMKEQA